MSPDEIKSLAASSASRSPSRGRLELVEQQIRVVGRSEPVMPVFVELVLDVG